MRFTIAPPPEITQNTEAYLVALRDYLYQMADAINAAGNALDAENFTVEGLGTISTVATQNKSELDRIQDEAATLRELIIRTADYVESEIDIITQTLESRYEAISEEFGTYKEDISNTITTTASAITEEISKIETITSGLTTESEEFSRYMQTTSGKIEIGMIETSQGEFHMGVAIGERIDVEVVQEGDEEVKYLSSPDMLSTFTSSELAFYQNKAKLAWFSANQLYVANIEVIGTITQGDWIIMSDTDGWTLKYIGA